MENLGKDYVFIEETKELIEYFLEMKTHKIIPSARFHEGQLDIDRQKFVDIEKKIDQLDKDYTESLKPPARVLEEIEQCDDIGQADKKCPTWAFWEEWESCKLG